MSKKNLFLVISISLLSLSAAHFYDDDDLNEDGLNAQGVELKKLMDEFDNKPKEQQERILSEIRNPPTPEEIKKRERAAQIKRVQEIRERMAKRSNKKEKVCEICGFPPSLYNSYDVTGVG